MQNLHGFLTAREPKRFGLVDRISLMHILPLVSQMPGRVWAALVGNNDDVTVVATGGVHLRWAQNYWHLHDRSILESVVEEHGCSHVLAEQISNVCHALSDLRLGTVILIPDNANNVPKPVGAIDNSDLGGALKFAFLKQSFVNLTLSNSIVGVLTSDGLTTIAKDGRVLACGEIVDISQAASSQPTGGGRTHAAVAASEYGLTIKVSEDGPISVFKHGVQLIKM
jgi:DNA integrity scanning protein DisA with diadenylate cyclase activity